MIRNFNLGALTTFCNMYVLSLNFRLAPSPACGRGLGRGLRGSVKTTPHPPYVAPFEFGPIRLFALNNGFIMHSTYLFDQHAPAIRKKYTCAHSPPADPARRQRYLQFANNPAQTSALRAPTLAVTMPRINPAPAKKLGFQIATACADFQQLVYHHFHRVGSHSAPRYWSDHCCHDYCRAA